MSRPHRDSRQLRSFLWRASADEEVDADIAFHLDMATSDLIKQGMSVTAARAEAERRFGDVKAVAAASRRLAQERDSSQRQARLRSELRHDTVFAFRQLKRAPGFTLMALLTLGLGFGASAAVFSALYAVVLRPLPFDEPQRVLTLRVTRQGEAAGGTGAEFLALRDQTHAVFDHVAARVETGFSVRSGDTPVLVSGSRVSADYFRVFGVEPAIGRSFTAEEDVPGRDNVVVLSHRAWIARHRADPGAVGQTLIVDGVPRVIIGVMPREFDFTLNSEELWVPLALTQQQAAEHAARFLELLARVRRDVAMEHAAEVTTQTVRGVAQNDPNRRAPVNEYAAALRPFVDQFVGDYKSLLLILLGAGGFVLLIACTNVANLLIANGTGRSREFSIRAALGAGRPRLVRQLITEAGVLSLGGAATGVLLAFGLLRAVVAVSPEGVPRLEQARVDLRVLGFTLLCAAISTIVFGLVPALRVTSDSLERALRAGGRASRGGRDRLRAVLVGVQVALAMTLLVGTGLLLRSAWLLQDVTPGFDPRGVLTARVMLPEARYPDAAAITGFYERLHLAASELPAVHSAALVSVVPLSGSSASVSVFSDEQFAQDQRPLLANLRIASPAYFGTMRIPMLAGRDIGARDEASAPAIVVINEALAGQLWPGTARRDVIGRRINALSPKRDQPVWWEVVGVAADIRDETLRADVKPELYVPVGQVPNMIWPLIQRSLVLVTRARNEGVPPETLERPIRAVVSSVDANLPVADFESMPALLRGSNATARFNLMVLGALGGIALVLAIVGVYGVVSYFVSQRTQEIAVRMALGATPLGIWKYVASRGLLPLGAGLIVGALLAVSTTGMLEAQLYHVSTTDPLTIAATGALLLVTSLVATYVPAKRAIRVQPAAALNS